MAQFPKFQRNKNGIQPSAIPQSLPKPPKRDISYPEDIQFVLSIITVVADIVIVISYFLLSYLRTFKNKKVPSNSKETSKLPFICIAIAAIFMLCTLSYATGRFAFGEAPFWSNVILILKSGNNSISIDYVFRARVSSFKILFLVLVSEQLYMIM